jgi:thiol:disulfide interchange protein
MSVHRRRTIFCPALAIAGLILAGGLAPAQEKGAKPQEASNQKAQKPPVYDEKADAHKQIAAAMAAAAKNHQRVLVVFGANWCGWCRKLDGLFHSDRKIARELLYEYQVVKVDMGKWDKNRDLVEKFGATIEKDGVPYITILAADGSVVTNQNTGDLEAGAAHDPAKVQAFLKEHRAKVPAAKDVLDAALAEAKKSDRNLLVHLGAPW